MQFNTAQTVALCVGVVFAIVIILGLLFLVYASRRARREDREAAVANLGRWKEVAEVDVPTVPKAPVLRGRPSWQGLTNPSEPIPASISHTLPSQMIQYDRMVSHGVGQEFENPYSQKMDRPQNQTMGNPYREVRATITQDKGFPAAPRENKPVKAVWRTEKSSQSRTWRPERIRDPERSDHRRHRAEDRSRSSGGEGSRSRPAGRDDRRRREERRTRR